MKIHSGDTVTIISGSRKNKGKSGKVLKAFPSSHKILVEGINIVTRHLKKQGTTPGQIVKIEKPIDVSNAMLLCPFTQKPTRIGYVMVQEKGVNKKYRFSKRAVKETAKSPKDCIIK